MKSFTRQVVSHLNRIGALHLPSTPGPAPPEQGVYGWGQLSNEESTGMELLPIQCETLIELGNYSTDNIMLSLVTILKIMLVYCFKTHNTSSKKFY